MNGQVFLLGFLIFCLFLFLEDFSISLNFSVICAGLADLIPLNESDSIENHATYRVKNFYFLCLAFIYSQSNLFA